MLDLVIQTGKQQGYRLSLPLDKTITVGRDPGCQLTLASTLVSRRHCELTLIESGILINDLNSQNGTYVNDVPVTFPITMLEGDTLRIGACVFEARPRPLRQNTGSTGQREADTAPRLVADGRHSGGVSRKASRTANLTRRADITGETGSDWAPESDTIASNAAAKSADTTVIRGRTQVGQTWGQAARSSRSSGAVPSGNPSRPLQE